LQSPRADVICTTMWITAPESAGPIRNDCEPPHKREERTFLLVRNPRRLRLPLALL